MLSQCICNDLALFFVLCYNLYALSSHDESRSQFCSELHFPSSPFCPISYQKWWKKTSEMFAQTQPNTISHVLPHTCILLSPGNKLPDFLRRRSRSPRRYVRHLRRSVVPYLSESTGWGYVQSPGRWKDRNNIVFHNRSVRR